MKWISVKDRLPDSDNQYVLLYSRPLNLIYEGTLKGGSFFYGDKMGFSKDIDDEDCDVTHWMPLPDPPETGH